FWLDGGHLLEGRRWSDQALSARPEHDVLRAAALTVAGSIEFRRGRHEGALERYAELLDVERELADPARLGRALVLNAMCGWMTMDWAQTQRLCREALGCGEPLLQASARHIEGLTHWYRGAQDESRAALDYARAILGRLPSDHPPDL